MFVSLYLEAEPEDLKDIQKITALPIVVSSEIEVEIEYNIYGKYLSASWDHPAEYPELEIEDTKVISIGNFKVANLSKRKQQLLLDMILVNTTPDEIEVLCWEDAEGGYDDYFY